MARKPTLPIAKKGPPLAKKAPPSPPPRATANVVQARMAARKLKAKSVARPGARRAPARKPVSIKHQLLLTVVCIALLAAALPTALMLSIALLPAICAFAIDRKPGRYATICVGMLNVAGTWPFLLKLWTSGHSVVNAMKIVLDPFAWLIIYSAAAVGWLLYFSFPSCVSMCMSVFAGHRISQLRQNQKKLIEEWGPEVASHHTAPRT